jgi:hypothetical protein
MPRTRTVLARLPIAVLLAAAAVPALAEEAERPVDWDALHAQKTRRQNAIVREFFDGRRDGVFVDVGSAHYRDLSTTYFLEKELGWSGIAIDALEHWKPGYAEHRPRTRFFNYIVTDHAGAKEPFYRLEGDIGSTAVKERADTIKQDWKGEFTEVLVPTITLDRLLKELPSRRSTSCRWTSRAASPRRWPASTSSASDPSSWASRRCPRAGMPSAPTSRSTATAASTPT